MNVQEMIDLLGLRLEDAAKGNFTDATKLLTLNDGVKKVANLIHPGYLTELEYLKTSVTLSSGAVAMTAANLDYKVLKGKAGVIKVKVSGTSGLDCTPIDITDRKRTENSFNAGTVQNPLCYVFQNTLYVLPTTITTVDVYFRRVPNQLLYPFNADQADSGASASKFDGRSADSLSTVNDYYNGAVIYSLLYDTYHVITDYVGADLEFTVSPASTLGNFTENQQFYFLTHSFNELGLSGVDCDLNEALHELVVSFAEATCWKMDEKIDRSGSAYKAAMEEIGVLNSVYEDPEGIGTDKRKREKR